MSNEAAFKPGDRAILRIGRNLVEVRVQEAIEGGWNVVSRTGKTIAARALSEEERAVTPGAMLAPMGYFATKAARAQSAAAAVAQRTATATAPAQVASDREAATPDETAQASAHTAMSAETEAAPIPQTPAASTQQAFTPSEKAVPPRKLSLVNAAAAILEQTKAAMSVGKMIAAAKESGLWAQGAGKTPEQTLYSAIIREIRDKAERSRFRRGEAKGTFEFALAD